MSNVSLKNICKKYPNGYDAVQDFNLEVKSQEFIILVGPSGCGKTTTLRMIAGLEDISSGELWIDQTLMNDVEPKNRDIAMVFQNYALYPHMTVFENMAFGLKMKKIPVDEIKIKVQEAAEILGIPHLLQRKPKVLSGGEKQRVAMGRAIVRKPKVFLLDEPLSNLDAKLRAQMRTELANLHQRLQSTIIYVTHDQTEAMTLGTRIVVMKDGTVQQIGTPQNVYSHPANVFVAGFIGTPQMNFFNAVCIIENANIFLHTDQLEIKLPSSAGTDLHFSSGQEVIVGVRPEDLLLVSKENLPKKENRVFATVKTYETLGSEVQLHLKAGNLDLIASKIDPNANIKAGDHAVFEIKAHKIHLFNKETEQTIPDY